MTREIQKPTTSRKDYVAALGAFDAAICEAIAVSQASAGRMSRANVGYASYVFAQMCGAGSSLIRAAPLTRWAKSDSEDWRFGSVAGHARSLLDGFLLFSSLIEPVETEAELEARVITMHINDCTRRIALHKNLGYEENLENFDSQRRELQDKLANNQYFNSLPPNVKKSCMNGEHPKIATRDEILEKIGLEKGVFKGLYDFWSQHVHILPLSFFRMEPNGRGTGIENATDRYYIAQALTIGAAILSDATDMMVEHFPDVIEVRQGIKSKFSPGPAANRPAQRQPIKTHPNSTPRLSTLSDAIRTTFGT